MAVFAGTSPTSSLQARLIAVSMLLLTVFLGATALALNRSFDSTLRVAIDERLRTTSYLVMGAMNPSGPQSPNVTEPLADPNLNGADSGVFAQVATPAGEVLWRSPSALGAGVEYPPPAEPGTAVTDILARAGGVKTYSSVTLIGWELDSGEPLHFIVGVAADKDRIDALTLGFERNLRVWLIALGLALLAFQIGVLRATLTPLRRVAREVADLEQGRQARIEGRYPVELNTLTVPLNAFVSEQRRTLERHRNALSDLAHSLKTPLAVLQARLGGAAGNDADIQAQLRRLDEAVDYHLKRAATAGPPVLGKPVVVSEVAKQMIDALAKVYHDRNLSFEVELEPAAVLHGERGDLTEILGNLLDNASKWARSTVRLHCHVHADGQGDDRLVLTIEDDGPGFDPTRVEALTHRGERADPSVPGQGIGLAVVKDIVERAYRGRLELARSDALGGARVVVQLPL